MIRTIGERRADAVAACRDRFVGKTYDPSANRDCLRLAGHATHKMGRKVSLTKGLRYSSEAGGLRMMRKLGFASLLDAVDAAGFQRIAPAMTRPGDLIALKTETDNAFGCALTVAFDNGRVIGFLDGVGAVCRVDDPDAYIAAWRIVDDGRQESGTSENVPIDTN